MRIDSSGIIASLIQGSKESQHDRQQAARPPDASFGSQSDKVTLTTTASKLQLAGLALENQPIVDAQRVEKIQSTVNDGRLNINTELLAGKLINFEQALNSARERT